MVAVPAAAKPATPLGQNKADSCSTIKDGVIEYGRFGDPNPDIIPIGYDTWRYNYQAHMFNGYYDNYSRPEVLVTEGTRLQMKWSDEWLSNKDCNGDGKLDRGYSCDPEGASNSACPGAWLTNHEHGSYDGPWNVMGEWVLEFDYLGRLYIHDMTVVDNIFTGVGGYPSEGPYTTTWTVEGTVDDNDVDMRIEYDGSSYYVEAVGTIASDGTMSGTWSNTSQSGTWKTTSGMATKDVCEYDYFVKIVTPNNNTEVGDYKDAGMWYNVDGVKIGPVIWGAYAIVQEVENDPCGESQGLLYKSPLSPGLGFYTP